MREAKRRRRWNTSRECKALQNAADHCKTPQNPANFGTTFAALCAESAVETSGGVRCKRYLKLQPAAARCSRSKLDRLWRRSGGAARLPETATRSGMGDTARRHETLAPRAGRRS